MAMCCCPLGKMTTPEGEIKREGNTVADSVETDKKITEVLPVSDVMVTIPESAEVKIEDFIIDATPRGGDDDMLEGTEIKTSNNFDDNWSDSSSEDEESDIIFQTCSSSSQRRYEKPPSGYSRPDATKSVRDDLKAGIEGGETSSEALKPLRFSYHRTAFDVDIEELDETPWREHHTDISDYFNYGFSETTWNLYCAKQLKIRADRGDGPAQSVPQPPVPLSVPVPVPSHSDPNAPTNANEAQSAMFLSQLQDNMRPPQRPTLVPGGQYLQTPLSTHSRPPVASHDSRTRQHHDRDDRYDRDRFPKRGRY